MQVCVRFYVVFWFFCLLCFASFPKGKKLYFGLPPTIDLVTHYHIFFSVWFSSPPLIYFHHFLLSILQNICKTLLPLRLTQSVSTKIVWFWFLGSECQPEQYTVWSVTSTDVEVTTEKFCCCSDEKSFCRFYLQFLLPSFRWLAQVQSWGGWEGDAASFLWEQMNMLGQKGLETSGCGGKNPWIWEHVAPAEKLGDHRKEQGSNKQAPKGMKKM